MKKLIIAMMGLAFIFASASAYAQEGQWNKEHPRRTQVNKRLKNQNKRRQNGVKNGRLTKGQANRLARKDHAIRKEERADAAANGGHITKAEQRHLNKQENAVSRKTFDEKHPKAAGFDKTHPRRAEVNGGLAKENHKISSAEKNGKLTADQAGQLNKEDKGIRTEERADAAANDGHLTKAEQQQINKEESSVNQERRADEKADSAASPAQAPVIQPSAPATPPAQTPPAQGEAPSAPPTGGAL